MLLLPSSAYGQTGIFFPYKDKRIVSLIEERGKLYGLGVASLSVIPLPDSVLGIKRSIKKDEKNNTIIIREELQGDRTGHDYRMPLQMRMDRALSVKQQLELEKMWNDTKLQRYTTDKTKQSPSKSKGLSISLPVPMQSERLNRLVGGGGQVNVIVSGNVNIDGKLRKTNRSQVYDVYKGSDYAFIFEQTQNLTINGKIGEKININVNQNSQQDWDYQNDMRLNYTGTTDEIIRSFEAGNISMSLPGSQFLSFGGANKGLFGFKMVNKLGPLDVTSIMSIQRGEKQSLTLHGGSKTEKQTIKDYEYIHGKFFFVDTQYRDNFSYTPEGIFAFDPNISIDELELWKSDVNYNTNPESKEAWAVWTPRSMADADTLNGGNQNNVKRHFVRLVPNQDYYLNKDLGYITIEGQVFNEVLALAYKTKSGYTVGDLITPDQQNPPQSRPFILKLLKTDNPLPQDSTWSLEWKNVYYLGKDEINKTGFDLQIVNTKSKTRTPVQDEDKSSYIEVFGLDRRDVNGSPKPDNIVDINDCIINFGKGYLILPGRRPFDPVDGLDPFTHQPTKLAENHRIPQIYDNVFINAQDFNNYSQFEIEVSYQEQSQSFSLGAVNIIEGSEEINLDGRKLAKGLDYDIDYYLGKLTLLKADALQPGTTLEVKYESGEFLQLEKKSLFGTAMKYTLPGDNFIGGSFLMRNERTIETRTMLGEEPKRNVAWELNSNLSHKSSLLSSLLDKLPFIKATSPASVSFQGGFAQILPTPNTINNEATGDAEGVAYIDDFESSKRINSLNNTRRLWTMSSPPILKDPVTGVKTTYTQDDRVKMLWYNPWRQIQIQEIFPNKETSERTQNITNILTVEFTNDSRGRYPTNPWGGIMQWLESYFNQSETKYIDIWVKGDKGVIHIDLGYISEDAVPNGRLDNEDLWVNPFPNGILDDGEDLGLWHKWNLENPDKQWDDYKWDYKEQSDDYTTINYTGGNGTGDKIDGIRIPDTEDIDHDGSLDMRNEYFQYSIDIGNDNVSGKYKVSQNTHGWKLYRIPLKEFIPIGKPDWSHIEYARLWFTDLPKNQSLSIYSVELVGNIWRELGVARNDSLMRNGKYVPGDSIITVNVVNTEENQGTYYSPEGVQGMYDRITQVHAREQSLELRFKDLESGYSAAARSVFPRDKNAIHYRHLKMYVYGDPALAVGDSSLVEFYFQIGMDDKNYYEIRKRIYPRWDERNELNVDIWELAKLKTSLYNGYRDLENGEEWRAIGNPTLQKLRTLIIGVKNLDSVPRDGFLWVDELRASDIEKVPGKAYRSTVSVDVPGIASVSAAISRQDADFHSLDQQFGSSDNATNYSFFLRGLSLNKVFSVLRGFNIPIDYSFNRSLATPKYLQGSDILYSPDLPEANKEKKLSYQNSLNTSFGKQRVSKNWFVNNTIEAVSLRFSRQYTNSQDVNTEINKATSYTGGLSHTLDLGQHTIQPFKFLNGIPIIGKMNATSFTYVPEQILSTLNLSGSFATKKLRNAKIMNSRSISATRGISTSYKPFTDIRMSYARSYGNDLSLAKSAGDIVSQLFQDSTLVATNQQFSADYNPHILDWLSPNIGYQSSYSLSSNRQLRNTGTTASSQRSYTANLTLNPINLMSKIYKSPQEEVKTPRPSIPPPPNITGAQVIPPTPQPGKKPEEQKKQQKDSVSVEFNPLYYLDKMSKNLSPIQFTYNRNMAFQNPNLDGKPSIAYQFGFSDNPGVPILENLGRNTGTADVSNTARINTSYRAGSNLTFSLTYNKNNKRTNNGNNINSSESQSMFIFKDTKLPLPEYSMQVSNLQNLAILRSFTNVVSLSHGYHGSKSVNRVGFGNTVNSTRFESGFRPLAGIGITWKKGINSSLAYDTQLNHNLDQTGAERKDFNNTIRADANFRWSSGLNLSLPFGLMQGKIKNDVRFNIAFSKTDTRNLAKPPRTTKFLEQNKTSYMSLKPTIQYSFTQHINGNFFYEWKSNYSKLSKKTTTRDFGMNVSISIEG